MATTQTQDRSRPCREGRRVREGRRKVTEFNEKAAREQQEGRRRLPRLLREGRRPVRRRLREGRRRHARSSGCRRSPPRRPTSPARSPRPTRAPRANSSPAKLAAPLRPSRGDSEPRRPALRAPRLDSFSLRAARRTPRRPRSAPRRWLRAQLRVGADRGHHRRLLALVRLAARARWRLSVSADISRLSAIASTTRSDGSRSPRSICDRYGFEMPTRSASWRIVSSCISR